MIYETAYVVKHGTAEENLAKIKSVFNEAISAVGGETIVNDDWGVRTFAQPTEKGDTRGHYIYAIYRAPGKVVAEIERRMKISEIVLKWIIVKLGEDSDQAKIVKGYRNPNHESSEKKDAAKLEKDRKNLSKRKSCYFTLNKIEPDWKDPQTYNWFVNEFGKISPGRVTGLRPRYQRSVTKAIKRGRVMGMISYLSSETSERIQ